MNSNIKTFLALGDSYTIGEAVSLRESFPYQTVALLRQMGHQVAAPEIVATTGWTTDELAAAIRQHRFLHSYDLVTLLVGVNNQYRGRALEQYAAEFLQLLEQALAFAGNRTARVVVLSIPDYGITPFAIDRNPQQIGSELDAFNAAAKSICDEKGVSFLDITTGLRDAAHDPALLAPDGLHPSAKAYAIWASALAALLHERLNGMPRK